MCDPKTPAVQAWRSACEILASGLDSQAVDRVLRWISIESCGNPCSIDGSKKWQDAAGWIQDAGVMQIYFETQHTLVNGASSGSLRVNCAGTTQAQTYQLSDEQRVFHLSPQIAWLRGAIDRAQRQLDAVGANWSERDRWRWYKFSTHGLPAVAVCMLPLVTRQLGNPPSGWDEFRSTCEDMDLQVVRDAAALPVANDCTACLGAHGAWQMAFDNAEEMDLPTDEGGGVGGSTMRVLGAIVGIVLLFWFFGR
jgi:hypothetical protein